jgi:hypothetical protein
MVQIALLAFLFFWVLGAAATWTLAVHDAQTALQFAFLGGPPTLVLISAVVLAYKFAK